MGVGVLPSTWLYMQVHRSSLANIIVPTGLLFMGAPVAVDLPHTSAGISMVCSYHLNCMYFELSIVFNYFNRCMCVCNVHRKGKKKAHKNEVRAVGLVCR